MRCIYCNEGDPSRLTISTRALKGKYEEHAVCSSCLFIELGIDIGREDAVLHDTERKARVRAGASGMDQKT